MPRPLILESQSLINGLRRDAEGDSIYMSLRTMENLDVLRDPLPLLSVRSGYTQWNSVALAALPQQLLRFSWQNQAITINGATEVTLVLLANGDIYQVGATGTPIRIYDGTASMPIRIPGISVGDRFFFGTDLVSGAKGFYWTDPAGVIAGVSYQVGIDAPSVSGVSVLSTSLEGYTGNVTIFVELADSAGNSKLAQEFRVSVTTLTDAMQLKLDRDGLVTSLGRIRIRVETDSIGLPSGNLVHADAVSDWVSVQSIGESGFAYKVFPFPNVVTLSGSTPYHLILEGDSQYGTNFTTGVNRIKWDYDNTASAYASGEAEYYNQPTTTWSNDGAGNDFSFLVGTGIDATGAKSYYYKLSGYNSTYKIESPLSNPVAVYSAASSIGVGIQLSTLTSHSDAQVDKYRLYRTLANPVSDKGPYYFIGEFNDTATDIWDTTGDSSVRLRPNNFLIQPLSDVNGNRLAPNHLAHWNGRIWASVPNSGTIYFSARIEEENALGVVGDSLYDVFPAENTWKFDLGEPITGLYNFYDRLVVTFKSHIRVMRGGDSPLNPPDDLYMEEAVNLEGCADGYSIAEVLGKLVFVNQHNEVKAYQGGPSTLDVNDFNFSLWQGLGTTFRAANIQNQYWCLASRGSSSETWIYNASTESPRWTLYKYNTNLNDIGILSDGTVLACDTNSNYLLRLNNGTTDNGTLITAIAEVHPVPSQNPRGRSRWNRCLISAYYPSVVPVVTIQGIDRLGNLQGKTITPSGSDGAREHWTGLRIFSEQCAARITMVGQSLNQIRRIWLGSTRQSL